MVSVVSFRFLAIAVPMNSDTPSEPPFDGPPNDDNGSDGNPPGDGKLGGGQWGDGVPEGGQPADGQPGTPSPGSRPFELGFPIMLPVVASALARS